MSVLLVMSMHTVGRAGWLHFSDRPFAAEESCEEEESVRLY